MWRPQAARGSERSEDKKSCALRRIHAAAESFKSLRHASMPSEQSEWPI